MTTGARPRRSPLVVVWLAVFIDLVGFGIIIPLQPFYVEATGGSGAHVGALFAAYSFAQFVCLPLWGRLSDRIGRRPVLLMTLLGTGISFLVFAAAYDQILWLFVARTAAGAFGGSISTAQAYIGDVTAPEDRARGMGLVGMAIGMGFVLGPALGGLLALLGPAWPPAFAGVLALGNAALAFRVLSESRPPEARSAEQVPWRWFEPTGFRAVRGRPVLAVLFVVLFLSTFAFSQLETTFALLVNRNLGFERTGTALLFVYMGVIGAAIQGGLFGRLGRRFGVARLVVVAAGLLAVGLLLLPWVGRLGMMLAVLTPVAIGFSLNRPGINTLISLEADAKVQGAVLGSANGLASLARVFGPATGGVLWDLGYALPYQVGAAVMGVAGALAVVVMRGGVGRG
jgi:MFS transporter, DHA1 family, tetracycline resistance protein